MATPIVGFTGDEVTVVAQANSAVPVAVSIVRVDFGDGTIVTPPAPSRCEPRPVTSSGIVDSLPLTHQYWQPGNHQIVLLSTLGCGANPEPSTQAVYSYQSAPPVATAWPNCQPSQLAGTATLAGLGTGHVDTKVDLTNVSAGDCTMYGYPGLQMISTTGARLATTVTRASDYTFAAVTPGVVGLVPGASASFDVGWGDVNIGNPPQPCQPVAQLAVILPNDTSPMLIATGAFGMSDCSGVVNTSPVVPGTSPVPFS
ncbi:MAG: DUF4232 domain-containing protein [Acidimicrobiales bacterium]